MSSRAPARLSFPVAAHGRATQPTAHTLEESPKPEQAAACYQRLLALDRHGHQGIRYCRLSCLLGAGLYREAQAHVKAHEEKGKSLWSYARALAAFGRHGDGKRAGEALGRAIEQNPLAAAFLLDLDVPEGAATEWEEEDAERCAQELAHVWAETRGAIPWLSRKLEAAPDAAGPRRRNLPPNRLHCFFLRPCRRIPPWANQGMTEACADCGERPGHGEGVDLLLSKTEERFLCARCARTVLASRNLREGFEYPEFAPLSMEGVEGRPLQFEFLTEDIDTGIQIQMVEAGKRGEGYELEILGDHDADVLELFRSLNQTDAAGARPTSPRGREQLAADPPEGVVRALIDADDDRDDGLPLLIIDGRPVSWEVFGRMLVRCEGYQVKIEIYDLNEEIRDDSLDRSRYLMSKPGERLN